VRRPAAIVDKDIGVGASGERRGAAGLGGDVAGTLAPVSLRISSAVCSSVSAVRAVIVSSTPARPSDIAQARPNPLLAAQTKALRPRILKSNMASSAVILAWCYSME
jgi:hypothetical protein